MTILLCSLTALLPTIGRISSWLHLLPLLVSLVVIVYALWMPATNALRIASKSMTIPSRITKLVSRLSKTKGIANYGPVWFVLIFCTGMLVGRFWPSTAPTVYYGLRVQHVLPPDSMSLISPPTGPFRADFCPENHVEQYAPRPGYVMCKLSYVDRGCMDISNKRDGFIWVKDQFEATATLGPHDTFRPWPDCHVDEYSAKGGN